MSRPRQHPVWWDACAFCPNDLQGEILAPLQQIGRTYLLCTKCRRKLSQYKPIAR